MAGPRRSTDQDLSELLSAVKTMAVVGLSPDPYRPSNEVAGYLRRVGYRIVPVNPNIDEILGERSYPSLTAIPFPVDIAVVFRRPGTLPAVVADAIEAKTPRLWLQIGVVNEAAIQTAFAAGMQVVVNR